MKNISLIILGIFFISFTAQAKKPNSFTLTIEVQQAPNTDGILRVFIFDSEENWLKKGTIITSAIDNKEFVSIDVEDLTAGNYAISVIHDENNNKQLDSNMFGIPKEAYGFSNDARGMFGPASFEDSQFQLADNLSIQIKLK